jgi:hypothetical protein
MMAFLIPFLLKHWKELAVAGLILALAAFVVYQRHAGYQEGYQAKTDEDTAAALKAAQQAREAERSGVHIATDLGHSVETKAQEIHVRTETIIQKVPVYVTPETDTRYPLPVGFVRLHDYAALGIDLSGIPASAGESDDKPSAVTASRAATAIAGNYGNCREAYTKLEGWQEWYRKQAALANGVAH